MTCPACGYFLDALDKECPRCHGKGLAAPAPAASTPDVQQPALPQSAPSPRPTAPSVLGPVSKCICFLFPPFAALEWLSGKELRNSNHASEAASLGCLGLACYAALFVILFILGSLLH